MDLRAMIRRSANFEARRISESSPPLDPPIPLKKAEVVGEKKTIRIPGIRAKLNAKRREVVAKKATKNIIETALKNVLVIIAPPAEPEPEVVKPKFTKKEYDLYKKQQYKAKFATPDLEFEWATTQTKKCTKCGKTKCLTEYRGNTSGQDGFDKSGIRLRRPECKVCTLEQAKGKEIARKFAKENGIPYKAPEGTTCAICGQLPTKNNGLVFDHCHKTNTFRGYCCNSCNRSVGVLGDDVQSLLRAVNYLNKKEKLKFVQNEDGTLSIA